MSVQALLTPDTAPHLGKSEVAEQHRDVVCSLYPGLMQGALARMRAPLTVGRLEPFAEPTLCIAHLSGGREQEPPGQASLPGLGEGDWP